MALIGGKVKGKLMVSVNDHYSNVGRENNDSIEKDRTSARPFTVFGFSTSYCVLEPVHQILAIYETNVSSDYYYISKLFSISLHLKNENSTTFERKRVSAAGLFR